MADGSNLSRNAAQPRDGGEAEIPLRRMLATGLTWLERNATAIDAINVFPVPDGDTGSNMALTLQASLAALGQSSPLANPTLTNEGLAHEAAQGALLGARGNSGVILSQWLRGMAQGLAQGSDLPGWQAALVQAAAAADNAVSQPREGTMLSVGRAAAAAAGSTVEALLADAVDRAQTAVQRTPEQMPLLADAGVVDAGALGLTAVLEGFLFGLRGEEPPAVAQEAGQIDPAWLRGSTARTAAQGYCTEFVLTRAGASLDAEGLRSALGESVMVVGDADTLHAHLHTADPEASFALGAEHGNLVEKRHRTWPHSMQHCWRGKAARPPAWWRWRRARVSSNFSATLARWWCRAARLRIPAWRRSWTQPVRRMRRTGSCCLTTPTWSLQHAKQRP